MGTPRPYGSDPIPYGRDPIPLRERPHPLREGAFSPYERGFISLWGTSSPTGDPVGSPPTIGERPPPPTGDVPAPYERTPVPYGSDAICLREDPRPLREGHFSPMGDDILWGAKMGVPAEMK